MKIVKPAWVDNDGAPIFSVDVHPDGTRFATGGQCGDAGRVTIWNLGPVRSQEQDQNESVPKLLCRMDNHLACVNVVRWSHSGKYLASAGDDKVVMIWQISGYSNSRASFGGVVNVEQWRCVNTLRNHSGDILDLNWSPDDKWVATGSVDTTVVVWNTSKFPEIITVLKGHSGFVKGVSWDPVGKYLATQSDDKSLKIWRTSDWRLETDITKPFLEAGPTTHVLRSHWSPDGQFLVSAHAMNNCGPTAQIIEREGWVTKRDFVGHRKAVTCVRFNPNILNSRNRKGKLAPHSCVAFGSRDRSVSVWCTSNERPVVVLNELFNESVLDLSWSRDGYILLCCSKDGTVAYIEFNASEIGTPLSDDDHASYLQKLYKGTLEATKVSLLIEDPEILRVREEQVKKQEQQQRAQQAKIQVQQWMANGSNDTGSKSVSDSRGSTKMNKGPTDKQIETRMPDGRRRITPLYIPPPTDCDGAPIPFVAKPITFSSTESKTKILIEKRDADPNSSNLSASSLLSPPTKTDQNSTAKPENIRSDSDALTNKPTATDSTEKSKDQPSSTHETHSSANSISEACVTPKQTDAPSTSKATASLSTPVSQTTAPNASTQPPTVKSKDETDPAVAKSPANLLKRKEFSKTGKYGRPVKILKNSDASPTINGKVVIKKKSAKPGLLDKKKTTSPALTKSPLPVTKTPGTPTSSTPAAAAPTAATQAEDKVLEKLSAKTAESKLHFPSLKLNSPCSSINIVVGEESGSKKLVAEVENNVSGSVLAALRLLNFSKEKQWEVLVSSSITGLAGCEFLICIACDDSTISAFSTATGRRLQPPILLPSNAAKISCLKHYLMVITTMATVWVWNFKSHSVIVKNESLPLHSTSDLSLTNVGLTGNGYPLVSLNTGKSYVYDTAFSCWSLISNTQDILNYCSDYKPDFSSEPSSHPLAILQSQHKFMKKLHGLFQTNASLQRSGTLSFIDQQLAASFVIGSSKEYRYWLITLAQYLTEEGMESRLRELCQYLLGPPFRSCKSKWENLIVNNEKHELLREILAITTSNLKLQRIYNEFKQQLDLF